MRAMEEENLEALGKEHKAAVGSIGSEFLHSTAL